MFLEFWGYASVILICQSPLYKCLSFDPLIVFSSLVDLLPVPLAHPFLFNKSSILGLSKFNSDVSFTTGLSKDLRFFCCFCCLNFYLLYKTIAICYLPRFFRMGFKHCLTRSICLLLFSSHYFLVHGSHM